VHDDTPAISNGIICGLATGFRFKCIFKLQRSIAALFTSLISPITFSRRSDRGVLGWKKELSF